jgi:putative membrane protein
VIQDHGGGFVPAMPGAHPDPWMLVLAALSWVALLLYRTATGRLTARGDTWPGRRAVCAGAAAVSLVTAVLLPYVFTAGNFSVSVVQHLLMAMVAPGLLAMAAPVTLALRVLPRSPRRALLGILHSRYLEVAAGAPVLLVMDLGGLYLYYLSPVFGWAHHHAVGHLVVHLHMMVTGYLLSAYLIGTDPLRKRAPVRVRLLVLLLVSAGHDILAKFMYARALPAAGTAEEIRSGAEVMYYGGFAVELSIAVVLLAQWYAATGRELERHRRRTARAPVQYDH